jgi:ATP-dependent DNA ligase
MANFHGVRKRIKELRKQKKKYEDIAVTLNDEGYTTLKGKAFTANNVCTTLKRVKLAGRKKAKKKERAIKTLKKSLDARALLDLALDSDITKDQKIQIVQALA